MHYSNSYNILYTLYVLHTGAAPTRLSAVQSADTSIPACTGWTLENSIEY